MRMKLKLIPIIMVAVFALASITPMAAEYSDVDKAEELHQSVSLLSSLGVLTGYNDGSFRPENTITRAEFAAVIMRALGLGDAATGAGGSTKFSDVASNHWACGYINLAANHGVINGYPDGTFRPEEPVLYEQAIKMVVAALGYTPEADTKGGYPGGYTVIAAREGILSGADGMSGTPATRGIVATLVYNSLEVQMMEQVGFGTQTTFEKVSTNLLDKLDVEKVEGKVTKTAGSSDIYIQSYRVEYTITKRYENIGGRKVFRSVNQVIRPDMGNTEADKYLEQYTYAYIKGVDEDYPEILAIVSKNAKIGRISISSSDIDTSEMSSISSGKLYYFDDGSSRSKYIKFETSDTSLTYYYNGRKVDGGSYVTQFVNKVNSGINGVVEFLDNSADGIYDVIYVTDYMDIVVDSVSSKNYRVVGKNNLSVILDVEDSEYSFKIIKNNEEVDFDDIREGDVLSICGNCNSKKELVNGTVYIVSNSVIDGVVTGYNNDENIVKIDDVEYEYLVADSDIKLGYEGVFYINRLGKIVYADRTGMATNFKFGFMLNMGVEGVISTTLKANILTADGVWKDFEFADKVSVNCTTSGVRASNIVNDWNSYKPADWAGTVNGNVVPVYTMVSYSLNNSGYINKINFDLANSNVTDGDYAYRSFTNSTYNAYSEYLSSGVFTQNNTIVFDIGVPAAQLYTASKSDISVGTGNMLVHNAKYTGKAFTETETGNAVAIMGYNMTGEVNYTESVMIVNGIEQVYSGGDVLTKLTVYSDGSKTAVTFNAMDVTISDVTGLGVGTNIKIGDVISVSKNNKGHAKKIALIFRPGEMISGNAVINPYRNGNNIVIYAPGGNADHITFVYGIVRGRTNKSYSIAFDDRYESAGTYSLNSSANVYVYDEANYANPRIVVGDVSDIEIDRTIGNSPYSDEGSFVLLRVDSNTWVRDVIVVGQDKDFRDDNAAPAPINQPPEEMQNTPEEPSAPTTPSKSDRSHVVL